MTEENDKIDPSLPAIKKSMDLLLRDLEDTITAAQSGADIKLDGLDVRVGVTLEAVEALPPEEGRSLEERLLAIIGALDRLSEAITPPPPENIEGGEMDDGEA